MTQLTAHKLDTQSVDTLQETSATADPKSRTTLAQWTSPARASLAAEYLPSRWNRVHTVSEVRRSSASGAGDVVLRSGRTVTCVEVLGRHGGGSDSTDEINRGVQWLRLAYRATAATATDDGTCIDSSC